MPYATPFLYEARRLTGIKHLKVTHVLPESRLRYGYMTDNTKVTLRIFTGATTYDIESASDMQQWYCLTVKHGAALCTWQDPFGDQHHGLFNARSGVNMYKIEAKFRTRQRLWEVMASTDTPFTLVRQAASGAGTRFVAQAIVLARCLPASVPIERLVELSEVGNFGRIRQLVVDGSLTNLPDHAIRSAVYGAQAYLRAAAV